MEEHGTVRPVMATLGQIKELISAFIQLLPELTVEQAQYWIGAKWKLEEKLRFLQETPKMATGAIRNSLSIVVDYIKSLVDMVKAGNYDWVGSDIVEEGFPIKDPVETELIPKIICYHKWMESEDIIQDLKERGLRPGTIHELCAYGEKFPNEQRKRTIVALGSVCDSPRGPYVAVLCSRGGRRGLETSGWFGSWSGNSGFLAFSK